MVNIHAAIMASINGQLANESGIETWRRKAQLAHPWLSWRQWRDVKVAAAESSGNGIW